MIFFIQNHFTKKRENNHWSFYTRLAACLRECCPIIVDDLSQYLIKDFRYHLKKKDQVHNEVKIKNARYIGEATKVGFLATDTRDKIVPGMVLLFFLF